MRKTRRRPRKARRWLHDGKVPYALNQEFLFFVHDFFVHEYLGSERPVSFEVSAPTRLSLRGSHVRRKFRKRTTLRSERSTLKGLLYAGCKSRCEAFVARKGRTIALERSVSEKAVKDKRQSTYFHELGILSDSYLGCTA